MRFGPVLLFVLITFSASLCSMACASAEAQFGGETALGVPSALFQGSKGLNSVIPDASKMAVLIFPEATQSIDSYRRIFDQAHSNPEPLSTALEQARSGLVRSVMFTEENPEDTVIVLADGMKYDTQRTSADLPDEFRLPGVMLICIPPKSAFSPVDGPSLAFLWIVVDVFMLMGFGLLAISLIRRFAGLPLQRIAPKDMGTRFTNVAGLKNAKFELQEVLEFLKSPQKYKTLGANIFTGVLLIGPPGCGKTELARALAGEAQVPFFSISGSDFMEMFVGVGASRVRRSFATARGTRLIDFCMGNWRRGGILFIDEIDGVGGHRTGVNNGGASERENTLNRILVEMDGIQKEQHKRRGRPMIVIAATNRPQSLDEALRRPGRFDREIQVSYPDKIGRVEILKVHTRNKPLGSEIDLSRIAAATPGFSGADLARLANEAAIQAGRRKLRQIDQACFMAARDRILMGTPRGRLVMSPDQRETLAVHEAGHALIAVLEPAADPIEKATLVNFGQSLGHVMQVPIEDRWISRKSELLCLMRILVAGRAAEEVVFGADQVSNGAEGDFRNATAILCRMGSRFAMFPELRHLGADRNTVASNAFASGSELPPLSETSLREFDAEIKRQLDALYAAVIDTLAENRRALDGLARGLLEHETLNPSQIFEIVRASGTITPASPSRKLIFPDLANRDAAQVANHTVGLQRRDTDQPQSTGRSKTRR